TEIFLFYFPQLTLGNLFWITERSNKLFYPTIFLQIKSLLSKSGLFFRLFCETMERKPQKPPGRFRRVILNLRQGLALAWAASPKALVRYSVLGMLTSTFGPLGVWLGAVLVNKISQ